MLFNCSDKHMVFIPKCRTLFRRLFVGRRVKYQSDIMFLFCADFGVPLAQEQTIGPTSVLTFHVLEIDTIYMNIKIPYDKLSQLKSELIFMLTTNKVTLRRLQKLKGLLKFYVRTLYSGRVFV